MNVKLVSTKQQLEDAFKVRRTVFVDEQQVPEEEEIDQYEDDAAHFVLYNDNTAIGAGRFRMVDGYGKVERICILSDFRGTGAGSLLMKAIEDYAKNEGISKLKLNAQTHAIAFYRRLNYEVVSEEFLDAGIPHRTMTKSIF